MGVNLTPVNEWILASGQTGVKFDAPMIMMLNKKIFQ